MLTKTDYALAEEIVNGLSLPSELGPDEDSYFDDEWLVCQLDDICEDANIEYGISKVVIIPEEGNFVIKIPFNGMYYHYWDKDADCYDGAEFSYYHEACAPDSSDYCWDEVIKIEKACEMGFDKLFPATSFLMEKDGHRVYIQEKEELWVILILVIFQKIRAKEQSLLTFIIRNAIIFGVQPLLSFMVKIIGLPFVIGISGVM